MVRLVDDLMEVSRLTRGKIELRKSTLDCWPASLPPQSKPAARSSNRQDRADSERCRPQPLMVEADAMRSRRSFRTYSNNAVKYTDPGGRISIAAAARRASAVVT
jgi:signal transduction histidine kinase